MPPPFIPKKVEDIIYYYYAKLVIAPSAGFKKNYGFIINSYKRLKTGKTSMSDYERELIHLAEMKNICAFCGSKCNECEIVHIVPKSIGIKPGMHNLVYACKSCATSKGEKDLIEWWCKDLKKPRDDLPRIPIGFYLKIAYEIHKINFSLKKSCNGLEDLLKLLK